ncbi:MAG: hypothetical protein HRU09_20575, partial [Oligoflexales bacterium]|nr:hypothetical protein [Oligoflexales bacterium]
MCTMQEESQLKFFEDSLALIGDCEESIMNLANKEASMRALKEIIEAVYITKNRAKELGYQELASYARNLEGFLSELKTKPSYIGSDAISLLLGVFDVLRERVEAHQQGKAKDSWASESELQKLQSFLSYQSFDQSTEETNHEPPQANLIQEEVEKGEPLPEPHPVSELQPQEHSINQVALGNERTSNAAQVILDSAYITAMMTCSEELLNIKSLILEKQYQHSESDQQFEALFVQLDRSVNKVYEHAVNMQMCSLEQEESVNQQNEPLTHLDQASSFTGSFNKLIEEGTELGGASFDEEEDIPGEVVHSSGPVSNEKSDPEIPRTVYRDGLNFGDIAEKLAEYKERFADLVLKTNAVKSENLDQFTNLHRKMVDLLDYLQDEVTASESMDLEEIIAILEQRMRLINKHLSKDFLLKPEGFEGEIDREVGLKVVNFIEPLLNMICVDGLSNEDEQGFISLHLLEGADSYEFTVSYPGGKYGDNISDRYFSFNITAGYALSKTSSVDGL